jgi:nitroreductase
MATPKIQIAPELVAEGKRLYETTMTTIADIAALMGVSRRTLENRIVEWNWKRRRQPSGAIDIFHAVSGAAAAVATAETPPPDAAIAAPALAQQRAALAVRIQNVVEREMAVVERVVNLAGAAWRRWQGFWGGSEGEARLALNLPPVTLSANPAENLPMDVLDAVASRYSCRAFLPTPVPEATVRDILAAAARAPSGGNVQPWRVHALAGAKLEQLKARVRARPELLPRGEGAEYDIYPRDLKEPYETRRRQVGAALYQSIGVTRADRAGRYRQYARNFEFFGAPVGLLLSIDRTMGPPQWSDLGGYIQTVMLLARGYGLHTCGQEAWTHWHQTVYSLLDIPPNYILFCGLALGHADPDAAINKWRAPREPLDAFASFEGFQS